MADGAKKRSTPLRDATNLSAEDFNSQGASTKRAEAPAKGDGEPPSHTAGLRKFKAKRLNEHVKSAYSLANTLAAAIIGGAYILPEIKGEHLPQELDRPTWVGVGLAIFAFGHFIIWFGYQKED